MAVKYAMVEDMTKQGRLTSVTEDSRHYCDRVEVLAEHGMMIVVFPPAQYENYEVAERKHVEKKHSTKDGKKREKGEMGSKEMLLCRCLERCRRAASSNPFPSRCIGR